MTPIDLTILYNIVLSRLRASGALDRSLAALRRIDPTALDGYDRDAFDYNVECLRRDGNLPNDATIDEMSDAIVAEFAANLASFERHCRVHIVRC